MNQEETSPPNLSANQDRGARHSMRSRMGAMMFLEYFGLGLWAVTTGAYVDANTVGQGAEIFPPGFIGLLSLASALGSIVAPIIIGVLADRYWHGERLLAGLHLGCAASLWVMSDATSAGIFLAAVVVHYQFFCPTVSLSNALALRHLPHPERDFPISRAIGTVAWVVAGLLIGLAWPLIAGKSIEATSLPLKFGALGELLMAAYCLSLPASPPTGTGPQGWRSLAGGADLWRHKPFVIFLAISLLLCIPNQFYSFTNVFINRLGVPFAAAKMTVAQVTEVLCLVGLPFMLHRFGMKRVILIGAFAWVVRYICFTIAAVKPGMIPLLFFGVAIHGICYVFVYMVGPMYVNRLADRGSRSAAQGMLTFATNGIGNSLGSVIAAVSQAIWLTPAGVTPAPYRWDIFWQIPAGIGFVAAMLFMFCFHERAQSEPRREPPT